MRTGLGSLVSTRGVTVLQQASRYPSLAGAGRHMRPQLHQLRMKHGLSDPTLFKEQTLVDGKWVGATSGRQFDVYNPATQEKLGSVPSMDAEDARAAVAAAGTAWQNWKTSTTKQREGVLKKWAALCKQNANDIAKIMTLESGKPLAEAKGEVLYAVSFLEFFAEETKRINGLVIPSPIASQRLLVIKQPVGVCSLLTPWNFPAAMITRKAAPALAAGCTMVIKPAEDTPLTALALVKLAHQAGVPPGVINVVTCPRENVAAVGEELCTNPTVRKVSFTGSTAVGKLLLKHASGTVKRVSMELGGNAPFVVFEDADLDRAVEGAIASKFRFSGQTCVCTNRMLVHEAVYDEFSFKLVEKVRSFKLGDGMQDGVTHGPLINEAARKKVSGMVDEAVAGGARVLVGGDDGTAEAAAAAAGDGGSSSSSCFYAPTVLADVTSQMRCVTEEIFGPVAPLVRFSTEEEALKLANAAAVGLAGYVYTKDYARMFRFAEALEVGMVGVNEGMVSKEVTPFGGVKESGLGREGSIYGIEEYVNIKHICIGGF